MRFASFINWLLCLAVIGVGVQYARAPLEQAGRLRFGDTAVALGHVVEQRVVTGAAGNRSFVLDYAFDPEGSAEQTGSTQVYQEDYARLRTGAPVEIRYLVSDPAVNDVDGNAHADEALFFPAGILLAALVGAWLVRRSGWPVRAPKGWARIG